MLPICSYNYFEKNINLNNYGSLENKRMTKAQVTVNSAQYIMQ